MTLVHKSASIFMVPLGHPDAEAKEKLLRLGQEERDGKSLFSSYRSVSIDY